MRRVGRVDFRTDRQPLFRIPIVYSRTGIDPLGGVAISPCGTPESVKEQTFVRVEWVPAFSTLKTSNESNSESRYQVSAFNA